MEGDCGVEYVRDVVMHGADRALTVLHTERKKQETQHQLQHGSYTRTNTMAQRQQKYEVRFYSCNGRRTDRFV